MKKEIIGKKFGRLTVLKYIGIKSDSKTIFECKCECGKSVVVKRNSLVTNHTKSCGCLHEEAIHIASNEIFEELGINRKQFAKILIDEKIKALTNG